MTPFSFFPSTPQRKIKKVVTIHSNLELEPECVVPGSESDKDKKSGGGSSVLGTASLPASINKYMKAHGYNSLACLVVQTAFVASSSNKMGFVKAVEAIHMPAEHALFLWKLQQWSL